MSPWTSPRRIRKHLFHNHCLGQIEKLLTLKHWYTLFQTQIGLDVMVMCISHYCILPVIWSSFPKYGILCMPIPYTFALTIKRYTLSQGKYCMFYILPWESEWMDTSFTSVFLMEDWVVYHAPLFFPSIFMSIILSYIVCQNFAFHLLNYWLTLRRISRTSDQMHLRSISGINNDQNLHVKSSMTHE